MGEVLHEVDFNQLRIENQQYLEKIDERNQDLLRLKQMAGTTIQVLNSYKVKHCIIHALYIIHLIHYTLIIIHDTLYMYNTCVIHSTCKMCALWMPYKVDLYAWIVIRVFLDPKELCILTPKFPFRSQNLWSWLFLGGVGYVNQHFGGIWRFYALESDVMFMSVCLLACLTLLFTSRDSRCTIHSASGFLSENVFGWH